MIAHSLQSWATAAGMDRRTLETRLIKAGYRTPEKKGGKIPFRKILVALVGDKEAETVRNLKLEADRKEREEAEASGKLFPMGELDEWINNNYVVPMANILSSAPTTLDTRCNPEHPETARKVIEDWVEMAVKPFLKVGLTKPKKK